MVKFGDPGDLQKFVISVIYFDGVYVEYCKVTVGLNSSYRFLIDFNAAI